MKKFLFYLLCIIAQLAIAQQHYCSKVKRANMGARIQQQAREAALTSLTSHELEYDVKFVHLSLNVETNSIYISGNAKTVAKVTASAMDTFMTLLHQNHTIDSLRFNGALLTPLRQDSMVKVKLPAPLSSGSGFTVVIYYKGTAPVGGAAIGSGLNTASSAFQYTNACTWTLSESLVAYHWWPCKQILTDKIDSSWVFVTTDSINKAGSNGLLSNVVINGNKKRYEWKSHSPIAYYLISLSVAKYKEYNLYAHPQYLPNDSILIQNYIYDDAFDDPAWNSQDKVTLNRIKQTMEMECNLYGMYPFHNEKYGHCLAPLGGGMEHQTMTTLGFFDLYVDAHELGHQWFGDNVTCAAWKDIWMNEGFATYTEFLTEQHFDPTNFLPDLNAVHNFVMQGPGGSVFLTGHDTVDANAIFDERLTYFKGGSIIRSLQFVTGSDSVWFNCLRSFQNTYKHSTASVIDFRNYYQQYTGINATQFFNQWYYGQGYPVFDVAYDYTGSSCIIRSIQYVSMASATPLFVTPMEYAIQRSGYADTIVRVMHSQTTETYAFAVSGTVTGIVCDPNNWIINKVDGPYRDQTLTGQPAGIAVVPAVSNINIGPNPTKGLVLIDNSSNVSGKIKVFDLSGRQVAEKNLEQKSTVDLSNCADGTYLLKIYSTNGKEQRVQKIIKQ